MKKGFTLIELLVVVLIIGILAAVALPQYQKSVSKARLTEAVINGKALSNALSAYVLENNALPTSFAELAVELPNATQETPDSYHTAQMSLGKFSYGVDKTGSYIRATGNANSGDLQGLVLWFNFKSSNYCFAWKESSSYSKQAQLCITSGGKRDSTLDTPAHECYKF